MSQGGVRILLVDDETGILDTLGVLFRGEGYEVLVARSGREALERLESDRPDLVLTDIRMPGTTGLEVLQKAREVDPELPVILMTAQASLQSAVRAVNEGAYYYLQKPFANDELLAICRRASEARQLKVENKALKKEIKRRERSVNGRPVGKARPFVEVLKLAETVAPTDSTILISGESGTGKEVVARYIHALSDRAERALLLLNCGALPESLLESELFGHVKGSFTGRGEGQGGAPGGGPGGHVLPGRDRRDEPRHPGEAPAGPPGAGGDSGGRHRARPRGRAHRRGHEPGAGGGDPPGRVPERPLLPAQRHRPARPAPPGPAGGHPPPGPPLPPAAGGAGGPGGPEGAFRGGPRGAGRATTGPATCGSWRTPWSGRRW